MFERKIIKGIEIEIERRVFKEVFEENEEYLKEEIEEIEKIEGVEIKKLRFVWNENVGYLVYVNNEIVRFDY